MLIRRDKRMNFALGVLTGLIMAWTYRRYRTAIKRSAVVLLLLLPSASYARDYPSSVRIGGGGSTCSGTLFHKSSEGLQGEVFGLTAAHCFDKKDTLRVHMADGTEHIAYVVKRYEGDDLLLFRFSVAKRDVAYFPSQTESLSVLQPGVTGRSSISWVLAR
jgi:hypothetical protein